MSVLAKIPREIELLEKACAFLAECKDLDEVKKLRDKAEALRLYANQQKGGLDAQNSAAIVKLHAERRIGEISKDLDKTPGKRTDKPLEGSSGGSKEKALAEAGIPVRVANDCEAILAIPEEEFKEEIQKTVAAGKEVTTTAMVKKGRTRQRKKKQAAKLNATPSNGNGKHAKRTWEIRQGDCIEIMDSMPECSVRLAFADPPYNIGVEYGEHYDDDRSPEDFERWCAEWLGCIRRVLKPDGSLWLLMPHEWAARLLPTAEDSGLWLQQWLTWYESFGQNATRGFNRCSRALLWLVRDPKRFVFNDCPAIRRESDRQAKYNDRRADADGKLWDDVWGINPPIPRLTGTCNERLPGFPTQLPLSLLRPIVACASDENDVVLDPFCGSGTTGAACGEMKRGFIGIELSEDFVRDSRKRLEAVDAVR